METSRHKSTVIQEKFFKSPLPSQKSSTASSSVVGNVKSKKASTRPTVSIAKGHTCYSGNTLCSPWDSLNTSTTWMPDTSSCQDDLSEKLSSRSSFYSNYLYRNGDMTNTSMSVDGGQLPLSTTSYGFTSPTIRTQYSRTTVTLLNYAVSPDDTHVIPVLPKTCNGGTSTSSWTVESFTSPGLTVSRSGVVKVKYPWSPKTFVSYTDFYPSSVETLASRKGSRVNLSPGSPSIKNLTPFNYVVLSTNPEENPVLDWLIVKDRGTFESPKAIDMRV